MRTSEAPTIKGGRAMPSMKLNLQVVSKVSFFCHPPHSQFGDSFSAFPAGSQEPAPSENLFLSFSFGREGGGGGKQDIAPSSRGCKRNLSALLRKQIQAFATYNTLEPPQISFYRNRHFFLLVPALSVALFGAAPSLPSCRFPKPPSPLMYLYSPVSWSKRLSGPM